MTWYSIHCRMVLPISELDKGSNVGGMADLMWVMTCCLRHFTMTGVNAMGQQSFRHVAGDFFATSIMVAIW